MLCAVFFSIKGPASVSCMPSRKLELFCAILSLVESTLDYETLSVEFKANASCIIWIIDLLSKKSFSM